MNSNQLKFEYKGFAMEMILERIVSETRFLKRIHPKHDWLQRAITASSQASTRLRNNLPSYQATYGLIQNFKGSNADPIFNLDFSQVPAQQILDEVLGIDVLFNFKGYIIAIDVTTDLRAATIDKKMSTKSKMAESYKLLREPHPGKRNIEPGVDRVIILGVQKHLTPEDLLKVIKAAIADEASFVQYHEV